MQDEKIVQGLKFSVQALITLCFIIVAGVSFAEANWTPLPARTLDQPDFIYHPSPSDWRNTTIYQIITDRFYDGDPANNTANPDGVYNPLSMDGIHGGDFVGITRKLDYIKYLGFNAIWISPVFQNYRGVYHGYHITDFNKIDPHWGTLQDLRDLIDQAHARGIYVVIDVVFNHMARMTASDDPGFPEFSRKPYKLKWFDENNVFPPPFDDLSLFHAHGSIYDWEDKEQNIIGELRGLADLKTEDPRVREYLLSSHLALIAATDCDGFRVDTAHHVELDFWQEVLPGIKDGAAQLGKTNFMMFAEALRHRDDDVSFLTREGEFPSALYYPYYFTLKGIWAYREPTDYISGRWKHRAEYGKPASEQLVLFGDNHDRERLMNKDYLNGDGKRLHALLKNLYASPGIPCIYYGTEQPGFNGSKGHSAREPMFDPIISGQPDKMNEASQYAQWIKQLNQMRRDYPALQSGTTAVLHAENAAGLFAFTRSSADSAILVVLNNSTEKRDIDPSWFESIASDTEYVKEVETGNPLRVDIVHQIPPDTTYMWTTEDACREHTYIRHMEPPHCSSGLSTDVTFKIVFDQSLEATDNLDLTIMGESVNPAMICWTNRGSIAIYHPTQGLPENTWIDWSFSHPGTHERIATRFHTGRPSVNKKHPQSSFQPDGLLDANVHMIASNQTVSLYAAYDSSTRMLYLATTPAARTQDRFIMVAFTNTAASVPAPWNKDGEVPSYDILISDEGESDYTSIRGTKDIHWSAGTKSGVFEAALYVPPQQTVFVRTETYETRDKGSLRPEGSLPNSNDRYLSLDLQKLLIK